MKRITSNAERVGPWVAQRIFGVWNHTPAIGLESANKLIAGVMYENWNRRSIMANIVVEGLMTPAYLAAIFHYPFIYLGCDKVICSIAESNTESIRLCRKMGFQEEARLLDAHPDGSLLLYTLARQDCRFIGERYGHRINAKANCA